MSDVTFLVGVGGGFAALAVGALMRRRSRDEAAEATGLRPADLSHLPASLQATALWNLADGGFESGVLAGAIQRGRVDLQVTVFELETLRERRGEWAFLPVEPPFRLDGVVRVAVFRLARRFPHVLLKRTGLADDLPDRTHFERALNAPAAVRTTLGLPEGVEAELPAALPDRPLDVTLPEGWRVYARDPVFVDSILREPLITTLAADGSPDQVIELLDDMIVVYLARGRRMRNLGDLGPTPWPLVAQDIIDDGLQIVDAVAGLTAGGDPRRVQAG